jgi:stress response protein YsnF
MPRTERKVVVPRIEEHVAVEKRVRTRERVRVVKKVESQEVLVAGEAAKEDVEVERVSVNEYVVEPPRPRLEGDVFVIPVVEEVVVVEKRLLLKEEIRVRKRRRVVRKELRVPVRKERISIERIRNEEGNGRRTT